MRAIVSLLLLAACGACPEGFERVDGQCTPASSEGTAADPLSADNFQRRFSIRLCQEFERCLDEGFESDYWEVDCEDPVEWQDDCPYDQAAAEACLDNDWPCTVSGPSLVVYWHPSCDQVYSCPL